MSVRIVFSAHFLNFVHKCKLFLFFSNNFANHQRGANGSNKKNTRKQFN